MDSGFGKGVRVKSFLTVCESLRRKQRNLDLRI